MITIKNLQFSKPQHAWQVRVDRASVLGNPFYMQNDSQRDTVCNQYEVYFQEKMQNTQSAFYKEIQRLQAVLQEYGKLELFCWCAPSAVTQKALKNI
jgi:hypothetical protein